MAVGAYDIVHWSVWRSAGPAVIAKIFELKAGQMYVDGAVAGQHYSDGAVAGQQYIDGAKAAQFQPE